MSTVQATRRLRPVWMTLVGCLAMAGARAQVTAGVVVNRVDGQVEVHCQGKLLTRYQWQDGRRPYFFPVHYPDGPTMSRSWPMAEVEGEAHDHPHHRSFWFAYGDVNGHDLWSDHENSGRIEQVALYDLESGPFSGGFKTRNAWKTQGGRTLCTDERHFQAHAVEQGALMDYSITLYASHGPLTLGDTKEGMMAWRVPATMRLKGAVGQGHIRNSAGDLDGDTWGKRAAWCDYQGPVGGRQLGITIFDHPTNLRHPTWWHVRDYGLFAANPLGQHYFEGAPKGAGNLTIPEGSSLTLRYRFWLHPGDVDETAIAAQAKAWAEAD